MRFIQLTIMVKIKDLNKGIKTFNLSPHTFPSSVLEVKIKDLNKGIKTTLIQLSYSTKKLPVKIKDLNKGIKTDKKNNNIVQIYNER